MTWSRPNNATVASTRTEPPSKSMTKLVVMSALRRPAARRFRAQMSAVTTARIADAARDSRRNEPPVHRSERGNN